MSLAQSSAKENLHGFKTVARLLNSQCVKIRLSLSHCVLQKIALKFHSLCTVGLPSFNLLPVDFKLSTICL